MFGTVDTIIANAGLATNSISMEMSGDEFDQVLRTNLRGVFLTIREGGRRLLASGNAERGRVVVISSITARKLSPGTAAYSASKAAVAHMARLFAREWARKGINVNTILPGYFATDMTSDLFNSSYGAHMLESFSRKRMGTITDMDVPLLYLASDLSRHVTGSEFVIDDGQSLMN